MPHAATLNTIIGKIQTVLEQYMQLEREYVQLAEERDQLKNALQQQHEQFAEVKQKIDLLQLSLKSHVLESAVKPAANKDLQQQIKAISTAINQLLHNPWTSNPIWHPLVLK